jgi:dTDP-4-dehydrorhamnose 3,5-epimerase|tara:strand:- start:5887 stop:6435 length:549 start_codon:yes stop_codon:yes gene_type:complete
LKLKKTPFEGAFVVIPEFIRDERGFFARSYCQEEFEKHGVDANWAQCNISFNVARGTLRGLHYSTYPSRETKLVRCTAGSIFDVIVDIRPNSVTYGKWFSVELSSSNRHALFISNGFAHGFQTLADNTEVFYQMGDSYNPNTSRGIRFDDPEIGVKWPLSVVSISKKDLENPLLDTVEGVFE